MGAIAEWVPPIDRATFARLVVVSPHFDDAILSCGQLIATHPGATVLTVMGGQPAPGTYDNVSEWDAYGGFAPGEDVVAVRRAEDKAACDLLGAESRWLHFTDHQYDAAGPGRDRPAATVIAAALDDALLDLAPTAVFVPFGLAHPDHALTHAACRMVIDRRPAAGWQWFGYAEAGYQHIPGLVALTTASLIRSGLWPTPAPVLADGNVERKRAALACYATQLPALGCDWGYDAENSPRVAESFWRLAPPPSDHQPG